MELRNLLDNLHDEVYCSVPVHVPILENCDMVRNVATLISDTGFFFSLRSSE